MKTMNELFESAVDAMNRRDWPGVSRLCDPASMAIYRRNLLRRVSLDPADEPLTVERLMQSQPDMPREAAEYQVRLHARYADPESILQDEVPGIADVAALEAMAAVNRCRRESANGGRHDPMHLAPLAVLVIAVCDGIVAPCTDEARFGISVEVVDAATGGPVLSASIFAAARDGAYADSVRFSNADRPDPVTALGFAVERDGVYDLEITATGYSSWNRGGVRVSGGRCHVETVRLTASLQPANGS